MGSPRQKSALITGCSRGGIGDALAQELHRQGYRVFASVRNPDKAAHFPALGITDIVTLDVGDEDSISRAVETVSEATGGVLDMLVNNAGVAYSAPIADMNMSSAKHLFNINYFSVLAMTKAFTPLLIASGDARVVNIGSVLGELPRLFLGPYCSAKAALAMLSKIMRMELSPFGVQVVHVITGGIATKMIDNGNFDFPENSIYSPLRQKLLPFVDGTLIHGVMKTTADEYARAVVANATKPTPAPRFWYGSETGIVWHISTWWPAWLLDYFVRKRLGFLSALRPIALENPKTK